MLTCCTQWFLAPTTNSGMIDNNCRETETGLLTFCHKACFVLAKVTVLVLCCRHIVRWFSSQRDYGNQMDYRKGDNGSWYFPPQLLLLTVTELKQPHKRNKGCSWDKERCQWKAWGPAPRQPAPAAPAAAAASWGAGPGAPLSRGPRRLAGPAQRRQGWGSWAGGRGRPTPAGQDQGVKPAATSHCQDSSSNWKARCFYACCWPGCSSVAMILIFKLEF